MPSPMNRLDHVVWVAHAHNVARYADKLATIFDCEFDHRYGPDYDSPIDLYLSVQAGLELIAPVPNADGTAFDPRKQATAAMLAQHLDERGEGAFSIVFRVPDLKAAADRLNGHGYNVGAVVPGSPDRAARTAAISAWTKNIQDIDERFVGQFLGMNLLIGQFEFPDE